MIYLDAGATTLQKPPSVGRAMAWAAGNLSSPSRGSHSAAENAEKAAFSCRKEAAELFEVSDPSSVIFTANATHGLNIAIRSLVHPGSRVVISGYEHNAVTRPLYSIPDVELVILDTPLFAPEQMLSQLREALQGGADAVICNHVSNVFGSIAPVERIAEICRDKGIPLIVDASQSAGVLPVSMKKWKAAFVAMPGHKGLYGPQGTGLLLCGEKAQPLLYGGTGSQSLLQTMPEELPDRLEAGTHNMPGIAGLLEGIRFVRQKGIDTIRTHEVSLIKSVIAPLRQLPGVTCFYDGTFQNQTGVLSLLVDGYDCVELAEKLGKRGIAVRGGLHCAPLAHRTARTLKTGTVRLSPSIFNTAHEMRVFFDSLRAALS